MDAPTAPRPAGSGLPAAGAPRWQAVLFDLDGTLIDSMPLHQQAWHAWFAQRGLTVERDDSFFATTAGRTNPEILADMFPEASPAEVAAMSEEKEALYRDLARTRLQCIAGTEPLLVALRASGCRLAICTASPLANMAVAFDRFGLDRLVDTVTSPADGLRGKPHPDIFLAAAERLGAEPARCLVFEDAPLGIEAARRAGMQAVALTTTLPAAGFEPAPHLLATLPDFNHIDPALLYAAPDAAR